MPEKIKDMPALIAAVEKTINIKETFAVEAIYWRHDGRKGENRNIAFIWRIWRHDWNEHHEGRTAQEAWDNYSLALAKNKRKSEKAPEPESQLSKVKMPKEMTDGKN